MLPRFSAPESYTPRHLAEKILTSKSALEGERKHLGLGKLYRRTGQREEAQEHLTTATTMYREMRMTYWLKKAEAEIKDVAR
jgi:hypothetical protein